MKCCICGNECENKYGNSPWPLVDDYIEGKSQSCCDYCNTTKVVPARNHIRTNRVSCDSESLISKVRAMYL